MMRMQHNCNWFLLIKPLNCPKIWCLITTVIPWRHLLDWPAPAGLLSTVILAVSGQVDLHSIGIRPARRGGLSTGCPVLSCQVDRPVRPVRADHLAVKTPQPLTDYAFGEPFPAPPPLPSSINVPLASPSCSLLWNLQTLHLTLNPVAPSIHSWFSYWTWNGIQIFLIDNVLFEKIWERQKVLHFRIFFR